jgi:hypothetical protein
VPHEVRIASPFHQKPALADGRSIPLGAGRPVPSLSPSEADVMSDKEFNIKSEIMTMIAKTSDDHMRMVWMLMLGTLEQSSKGIAELGTSFEKGLKDLNAKLDTLLDDEQALRKSVLNGHEPNHHTDHDWIQARRKQNCSDVCEWSRKKMQEEAEAEEEAKKTALADKRAARDAAISKVVTVAISTLAGIVGAIWLIK